MNRGVGRVKLAVMAVLVMCVVVPVDAARAQVAKPKQGVNHQQAAEEGAPVRSVTEGAIASRYAVAEGVRFHYLVAEKRASRQSC